ncbi:aldose epimerase family protein [Paracoccus nototheniae]|uniref:aldose epimerase family protein n=1 Tax=Paracoccus nototheniae TaxID=2489002 RepID=UPI00103C443B|nr:aldose epimerase family protein [Paracoccus nototheniae]
MSIAPAGHLPDGREVQVMTLKGGGLTARVLTLGAIVQDLRLDGIAHPLVLGCPDVADYLDRGRYFGAIVGRCANRIAQGRFRLDGQDHQSDLNFRGRHTLHGGSQGTDLQLWQIGALFPDAVTLTLDLPDGHMGFPGTLRITARIALQDGALCFDLSATTDRATPCNLTHHGYFTLDGAASIAGHRLSVAADHYLPVDDDLIPTGQIAPVADTPFDFRHSRPVLPGPCDHNLCLSDGPRPLRTAATLTGQSGLAMTILTTACGLQVYDGAHLADVPGLEGRTYGPHAGIALEAQGWPDALNRPDFPDMILQPGATWQLTTQYRFTA